MHTPSLHVTCLSPLQVMTALEEERRMFPAYHPNTPLQVMMALEEERRMLPAYPPSYR